MPYGKGGSGATLWPQAWEDLMTLNILSFKDRYFEETKHVMPCISQRSVYARWTIEVICPDTQERTSVSRHTSTYSIARERAKTVQMLAVDDVPYVQLSIPLGFSVLERGHLYGFSSMVVRAVFEIIKRLSLWPICYTFG